MQKIYVLSFLSVVFHPIAHAEIDFKKLKNQIIGKFEQVKVVLTPAKELPRTFKKVNDLNKDLTIAERWVAYELLRHHGLWKTQYTNNMYIQRQAYVYLPYASLAKYAIDTKKILIISSDNPMGSGKNQELTISIAAPINCHGNNINFCNWDEVHSHSCSAAAEAGPRKYGKYLIWDELIHCKGMETLTIVGFLPDANTPKVRPKSKQPCIPLGYDPNLPNSPATPAPPEGRKYCEDSSPEVPFEESAAAPAIAVPLEYLPYDLGL